MKNLVQKSLFKIMLFVLVISMSAVFPQSIAYAETQTQELIYVPTTSDILVHLTFDGEKPASIVFVSPSGERYQPGITPESKLKYFENTKWINYKIFSAETGSWQIEYDKGNSVNAEFSASLDTQALLVQSFKVNKIEGTNAEVSFETSYDGSGAYYNYELYAVVDSGSGEGSKLLEKSSARSDELVTRSISLSSLSSYGAYKFRLDVYADTGTFEVFDSAYSDQFSFTNPNVAPAISGADITVDTKNMLVTVNWGSYTYNNDLFISVFADGGTEPIFYHDMTDWDSDEVYFDYVESNSKLVINLYTREYGVLSQPFTKEIDVKNLAVTIDSSDVTNQSQAKIAYNMSEPTEASLSLNESNRAVRLDGNDSFAVTLIDGDNTLSLTYADKGVKYIVSKDIFLDRMPPSLEIYEDLDKKKVTASELIITGKTDTASTVQINAQPVTVSEAGDFIHTITLQSGENAIEIKAIDIAGNAASKTISVSYDSTSVLAGGTSDSDKTGIPYLPLFISLGISLVVIILAIIFMKKRSYEYLYRKDVSFKLNLLNILSYATFILAAAAVVICAFNVVEFMHLNNIVTDISFLDVAETSVNNAYDYIMKKDKCFIYIIISAISAIAFLVASIVLKVLFKKKTPPAPPKPSREDRMAQKQKAAEEKAKKKQQTPPVYSPDFNKTYTPASQTYSQPTTPSAAPAESAAENVKEPVPAAATSPFRIASDLDMDSASEPTLATAPDLSAESDEFKCPNCGAAIKNSKPKFCPKCGTNLQ